MTMFISVVACLGLVASLVDASAMTLVKIATTSVGGGRCLDGSPAGYYVQQGADPNLFVIYLEGGGACYDEGSCKARAGSPLGSSNSWAPTMIGNDVYSDDCTSNPDFCHATHVFVRYCTGDLHAGMNTKPSPLSWGLFFDGHTNFAAIVDDLKKNHNLQSARQVLFAGDSAGGVGVFKNIDFLQGQLGPNTVVKGAPQAGWFFPAAIPSDLLDSSFMPSDWNHFSNGKHGNIMTDIPSLNQFVHGILWQERDLLPPACIADQKTDEWWACTSVDKLYKYIKAPLFVGENQYDTSQIFDQELVPSVPTPQQSPIVARYIGMYGEAMRNSTQQVLDDAPLVKKMHPDGLYSPSCLDHEMYNEQIKNFPLFNALVADWFFQRNAYSKFHRVVERCPLAANGLELPCNQDVARCHYHYQI